MFFFYLLMLLKKYIRSTCYLNNMYFLHANGHMSILYVSCRKFPTNRFWRNFLQPTYKNGMYPLNMWESYVFFFINAIKKTYKKHMLFKYHMYLKKYIKSTNEQGKS
jgi:hypothetical protein